MRQLYYTNYQSGQSGLSNAIMSIECGVVMAFLTNRLLLLDGNTSPPANVVEYEGRVDNTVRSRVTDLIDLPVAWTEPDERELEGLESRELTEQSLMDTVFYVPDTVDIDSQDAVHFARGRETWIGGDGEVQEIPLLRVSEKPLVPGGKYHRNNLCFYSYLFYFDNETRRSAYRMLERMQAKAPYTELARKVAADLGRFNAVHMRRGDFKVTYGVTVLDRQPWEAIEALDKHFSRDQRLLICTDERDDPFFTELKNAWTDHVFIDHHILDHFGDEFFALPRHDSIALAYLSQLVAAESEDFIGTMTSTFTSIIQRYRGNRGKAEPFKFLWNELPDPGERYERGRHPVSECVPLEDGIMVEEFEGPYSWNRYNPRINPAWMREWPESFLTGSVLETGALAGDELRPVTSPPEAVRQTEARFQFEGLGVNVRSTVPGLAFKVAEVFAPGARDAQGSNIASLEIKARGKGYGLIANGSEVAEAPSRQRMLVELIRYLVPVLCRARRGHVWLRGMLFRKDGQAVIYTGELGHANDPVADALCTSGWEFLGDEAIPLRADSLEAVPFARLAWPNGAAARLHWQQAKVKAIVHGQHRLLVRAGLHGLPPSVAAAELMQQSIDFQFDRQRAVQRVCRIASQIPVYSLSFGESEAVPGLLEFLSTPEGDAVSPLRREGRVSAA
ncbi:O-fucosyltransferase family protein [Elongatibacter sediminis]|uniref:O-fucosyltransferase family protein n=1 Tax=Elongatibacter sediminis TaxID=3119006 RepID=A0AAW9R8B1_9GAMM